MMLINSMIAPASIFIVLPIGSTMLLISLRTPMLSAHSVLTGRAAAVSYTHLDVYKRQVLACTEDNKEGKAAFHEKRPPVWKSR